MHLFDELPSTSRWLEERAAGGREADVSHGAPPVLCAVDLQSAGHGRRGKRWVSVNGNVAVSLLEHLPLPLAGLGGLSLVTGIAVAQTLAETTGLDVRIKWPNDLLVGDAKLGGLLIGVQSCCGEGGVGSRAREGAGSRIDEEGVGSDTKAGFARAACTRIITGIGLNVVHDPRVASLGIGGTSLEAARAVAAAVDSGASRGGASGSDTLDADAFDRGSVGGRVPTDRAPIDRDRLVGVVAARVLAAHERFAAAGWAAFADAWRPLDALAGRDVDVHLGESVVRGRALGVDADGALRVSVDGTERNFHGGEVSVRPSYDSTTEGARS